MPRPPKTLVLLLPATCLVVLLPLLSLQAQQPSSPGGNQPTAKDVIKRIETKKETAKAASDPIERIKEEGLKRSQVMATLSYLTDVIGPRLTGSPGLTRANEWTRDKLSGWGLENAHLEPWGPFGRGWSLQRFSAQVVEPHAIPLIGYPKAWSPSLEGPLLAPVVFLDAKSEADLTKFKGKLKGAIVLTRPARSLDAQVEPLATRLSDSELLTLANANEPSSGRSERRREAPTFERKKFQFLIDEAAALAVEPSPIGDGGTLFVAGASVPGPATSPTPGSNARRPTAWDKDSPRTVPQVVLATEHYNRLVRMIGQGESLKMAVDLSVQFHDDDLMGYNTIAEFPGTDLKHEVVMLGGHLDSWHSATGATDNAAGVAVAMEAVRILKTLNLQPRRTVRIALWTGEEQGLRGSQAYASKHFSNGDNPAGFGRSGGSEIEKNKDKDKKSEADSVPNPEFDSFSGYFNLDNGTGKIRGVYLQGNEAVRPIFRKWLQPFREMGAATLSPANTGGTDHLAFDSLGLPGFQFIQDPVEYSTRTHHSNQDVFDRIQADDMKQASVIMAAFVYNTAMQDEKLPRKPKPKRESPTLATNPGRDAAPTPSSSTAGAGTSSP
ncbi:M20/M25/M40 family metallo-hydrolase [Singulisphaera acidiphila]|uniref:Carboxypeptidase Q n=1 Tax=Singulisphaera acidiphila (strain ATCC BAA-1392 / DSM 18658 / VKM B-2454 / MOB10) TaxID=886293 RepID=L0D937_SINAD|nr:M20/M25/M40 family metallo-hydrolase [Singulisphaera acidiphila]AGA25343.1 putative aminopeptidase [Singulisphaera acidiphila DSM 18658]